MPKANRNMQFVGMAARMVVGMEYEMTPNFSAIPLKNNGEP